MFGTVICVNQTVSRSFIFVVLHDCCGTFFDHTFSERGTHRQYEARHRACPRIIPAVLRRWSRSATVAVVQTLMQHVKSSTVTVQFNGGRDPTFPLDGGSCLISVVFRGDGDGCAPPILSCQKGRAKQGTTKPAGHSTMQYGEIKHVLLEKSITCGRTYGIVLVNILAFSEVWCPR